MEQFPDHGLTSDKTFSEQKKSCQSEVDDLLISMDSIEDDYNKLEAALAIIRKAGQACSPLGSLLQSTSTAFDDPVVVPYAQTLKLLSMARLGDSQSSLAAHESSNLAGSTLSDVNDVQAPLRQRIADRFEIRGRIGCGSFGVVYRAFDYLAQREVALKCPRPELLAIDSVRDHFFVEGAAISEIFHPGVVPLLDMGTHHGLPYLVSRLVNGPSLQQWLEQNEGPIRPEITARWIIQLSEAVDHLHSRGILHCDLKPSNILLEHPYAENPAELPPELLSICVTDFGSAARLKDLQPRNSGRVEGALCYMAPEQLNAHSQPDARTDVYSICAVLYELLTRSQVFANDPSRELQDHILFSQPALPGQPGTEIPYALGMIILKGLAKKPEDRYATAADLAADLEAWLNRRTPFVLMNSLEYRLATWLGRNRLAVAILVLAMLAALLLGSHQLERIQTARRLDLERKRNEWQQQYGNTIVAAGKYFHSNNQCEMQFALNSIQRPPEETGIKDDPREFAWRYLNEMNRPVSALVEGLPPNVQHYVMVPSESTKSLWAGGVDGFVREIDANKNRLVREIKLQEKPVESIDISPDGKWLATGDDSGEIRLFNRSDLTLITFKKLHEGEVADLKFSRDSQKLISTGRDGQLHIWQLNENLVKPLLKRLKSGSTKYVSLYGMALLPDPRLVAVGTATGEILIVDIEKTSVVRVLRGHHEDVTAVVLSTSWKWLVSTGLDNSLCIWDLEKNTLVNRINLADTEQMNIVQRDIGRKIPWISQVAHIESLSSVAFDSGNGVISLYHIPTGIKMGELRGNNLPAWSVAYLPWSKRLATFSRDLQMRIWAEPFTRNITGHFFHFDLPPDGQAYQSPFLWLDPSQKLNSVSPDLKINSSLSPVDYYVTDSTWANFQRDYLTLVIKPTLKPDDPATHRIEFIKPLSKPETGELQFDEQKKVIFNYNTKARTAEPKLSGHPEKAMATLISTDRKLHFIDYSVPEDPRTLSVADNVNHSIFMPGTNQILVLNSGPNPPRFYDYVLQQWLDSWPDADSHEWFLAALSPDQSCLAIHRANGRLQFWDFQKRALQNQTIIPEIGQRRMREIRWMPDSQQLVASMGRTDIFLIDRKSANILLHWDMGNTRIIKTLVAGDGESIWVFDTKNPAINLTAFSRRITQIPAPRNTIPTAGGN